MTIKLKGSTDGSVSFTAPADTSPTGSDITLTLPTTAGSANQFVKNSGTAGTLEYSSMVEDSSGNVGIGTSSPSSLLHLAANAPYITFEDIDNNQDWQLQATAWFALRNQTTSSELLRVDASGKVLIGTTTDGGAGGISIRPNASNGATSIIWDRSNTTATSYALAFENNNSTVGSIRYNNTTTSYITTSDYRVKENVVDITDGITRVKQLAPKRFNFIASPGTIVDGFLAHEAQTVVPEAVTGTHNEVDDDGSAVMQGIDQSKLVPLLTAALQEAIAKIETLETKVAALEAGS